uniref:ATP synthase complex subunit 8 n=1 Tax=Lampyris noctiluca TaxID=41311 RepID=A0A343C1K5_9COLE|nr:ATP synthase F0 subunit 8 [Lampyris noctiluca]QEL51285.1 ATP synthase F0 subunit 8 [Lampyris noctiluca]
MPQMGPLNWLMLMIYFSMVFVMFNTLIYTTFNYSIKTPKISKIFKVNWKW